MMIFTQLIKNFKNLPSRTNIFVRNWTFRPMKSDDPSSCDNHGSCKDPCGRVCPCLPRNDPCNPCFRPPDHGDPCVKHEKPRVCKPKTGKPKSRGPKPCRPRKDPCQKE